MLIKVNQVTAYMLDAEVTRYWLRRFYDRHPILTDRLAQPIDRARNSVTASDMDTFHDNLAKIILQLGVTPDRLFNVDETAFDSAKKKS